MCLYASYIHVLRSQQVRIEGKNCATTPGLWVSLGVSLANDEPSKPWILDLSVTLALNSHLTIEKAVPSLSISEATAEK